MVLVVAVVDMFMPLVNHFLLQQEMSLLVLVVQEVLLVIHFLVDMPQETVVRVYFMDLELKLLVAVAVVLVLIVLMVVLFIHQQA